MRPYIFVAVIAVFLLGACEETGNKPLVLADPSASPRIASTFSADADHSINIEAAAEFIQRSREARGFDATRGGAFGKSALLDLLGQKDCIGMRFYYAAKEDWEPTLVLVGVNKDGNDMAGGIILEYTYPCPPFCGDGGGPFDDGP